jgi:hypothetical protein
MSYDWNERDEMVAAGSLCPVPDRGALVILRTIRPHGTGRPFQIVAGLRVYAPLPKTGVYAQNPVSA